MCILNYHGQRHGDRPYLDVGELRASYGFWSSFVSKCFESIEESGRELKIEHSRDRLAIDKGGVVVLELSAARL